MVSRIEGGPGPLASNRTSRETHKKMEQGAEGFRRLGLPSEPLTVEGAACHPKGKIEAEELEQSMSFILL